MNDTRKNILLDVTCSIENLRDCLSTLLREERRSASAIADGGSSYMSMLCACVCLGRSIAMTDDAIRYARSAVHFHDQAAAERVDRA